MVKSAEDIVFCTADNSCSKGIAANILIGIEKVVGMIDEAAFIATTKNLVYPTTKSLKIFGDLFYEPIHHAVDIFLG